MVEQRDTTGPCRRCGATPRPLDCFRSEVVADIRRAGGVWRRNWGEIRLPRVFGFCRGVTEALAASVDALRRHRGDDKRLVLLGEIIHNPWVNDFFRDAGVRILTHEQREDIERHVREDDCAIIPAFGVPLPIERRLRAVGCEIVDASCGDVRRLWDWAERAARDGRSVLIFGRSRHDETVVTKSRLEAAEGHYLVAGSLEEVDVFCEMVRSADLDTPLPERFDDSATNASRLAPLVHLAQVSQTTMLYGKTLEVRSRLESAFAARFGGEEARRRLLLQPTVCRATQDRQTAAVELCRSGCDVTVVVGGIGSSNSRHLYELAGQYTDSYFIEHADDLQSAGRVRAYDFESDRHRLRRGWLPSRRPLRIGLLAGASCPEIVVGRVLQRLDEILS